MEGPLSEHTKSSHQFDHFGLFLIAFWFQNANKKAIFGLKNLDFLEIWFPRPKKPQKLTFMGNLSKIMISNQKFMKSYDNL